MATANVLLSSVAGVSRGNGCGGPNRSAPRLAGIRHKVDQIIAGTVINIGALGVTNFIFLRVLQHNTQ